MLQRKQSLFLLVSFILLLISLCLPFGHVEPEGMKFSGILTNLYIAYPNGIKDFRVTPLSIILLLSLTVHIFTIFDYKNRKRQIKICNLLKILGVLWIATFFILSHYIYRFETFHPNLLGFLPFISLFFVRLAERAIKADEKLVKDADRIR